MNRVFRQAVRSEPPSDFAAQDRAHHTIGIADRQGRFDFLPAFQGGGSQVEEHLVVERVLQPMILRDLAVTTDFRANLWLIENRRVVQSSGFPVLDSPSHFDPIRAADHLIDCAEAESGHVLAHFLSDEAHEVDDMRGIALKFLAQERILRRYAHRAGV